MVAGPSDHGMQADVIFLIEGTAVNSAYLNDLKTNYLIPTLEYFSQGGIEDCEYVSEQSSTTLYGIVLYHAADCLPAPCTATLGPFSNPHKLLVALEKLEMVGGKGESQANIGEALATGLQCFEDLQLRREPNAASQKHCILVCNSPPYQTVIQESYKYAGHTVEQLASLYQERNINLSILSPRKIPALFKLFEKAGGDLQSSQTKNYAKDIRHLVLLRNYSLKERPVSPTIGPTGHVTATNAAQIPLSPLQSNDSPNTNQTQQNIPQPSQNQGPMFRNQTPQNITSVHQPVAPPMAAPMSTGRPGFNPQINAPPNYHPATIGARNAHAQWRMRAPFMAPGATQQPNTQGSALIAQLTTPPSSLAMNVPFGQRMDGNTNVMQANTSQLQQQQQQQQQQLTQQQLRLTMQLQHQQQNTQQQATMGIPNPSTQSQATSQLTATGVSQSVPTQVQQTVTASQVSASVSSVPPQVSHPQQQGNVSGGTVATQQMGVGRERQTIWQGIIEWVEKQKNPSDGPKQSRQVSCAVSSPIKDGEPELKADTWPQKLIMQLMPKQLIGSFGGAYLKNAKTVLFHLTPCEALESLTKVLINGFAGCVHFTSVPQSSACEIKVLILLYTVEKKTFFGFIPNDQMGFVDKLRKVIQHQKTTHALIRQSGGMTVPQQVGGASGGMMGQQRPQYDEIGMARQQNLLKIEELRQTLAAAQQQEAQYKSQLEVNIQQNLEVAQQQEMQYKQQIEAQQAHRNLNLANMANQQPNAQRMMRPVITNNFGLRHLLQQQQPQYRQVLGIQQQMVGPRGQMTARPMAPGNPPMQSGNPQNQQFDDVSNYDFLG